MDTRRFHKHLFDVARRLIPRDGVVLCAVSGGGDSMALLHGLHAINTMRGCGWRLHVAHLDHGLPQDSAAMMAFVRNAAARLGLPFVAERVDVVTAAGETGESIEEAGRKVRYDFLERAAENAGARVVALGHHADDQAETVLHRILRGTGLRGLAGMPERRPIRSSVEIEIVRPLLEMRRDDLRDYLRRRELGFMHDATNDDVHAARRNWMRHELIPLIEGTLNPEVGVALVRLARQAGRAHCAIETLAATAFDRLRLESTQGSVVLDSSGLSALPRAMRTELITYVLKRLGAGRKAIGFERIEAVADAAEGDGRLRRIELPGGLLVERRGARLIFLDAANASSVQTRGEQPVEGTCL